MPERVLIIEDDREIADLVALNLRDLGLAPERAADGRTGLSKALAGDWALIVLDLMLPQLDGLAFPRGEQPGAGLPYPLPVEAINYYLFSDLFVTFRS